MFHKFINISQIEYRILFAEECDTAMELVWRVFLRFEAPEYPKDGVDAFYDSIHNVDFRQQLQLYGAFHENVLVGVIATRKNGRHIALFFVDQRYQKLGIGKNLFQLVCQYNQSREITVNSSPYAIKVYEHLGFLATDTEQMVDGLRFTPMIYKGGFDYGM